MAESKYKPCPVSTLNKLNRSAEGKRANEREQFAWVARNLTRQWTKIRMTTIPDEAAVNVLVWARSCKENETAFFTQMWPRTFSRAQLDSEVGRKDAGKEVISNLDKIIQLSASSAEDEDE